MATFPTILFFDSKETSTYSPIVKKKLWLQFITLFSFLNALKT